MADINYVMQTGGLEAWRVYMLKCHYDPKGPNQWHFSTSYKKMMRLCEHDTHINLVILSYDDALEECTFQFRSNLPAPEALDYGKKLLSEVVPGAMETVVNLSQMTAEVAVGSAETIKDTASKVGTAIKESVDGGTKAASDSARAITSLVGVGVIAYVAMRFFK